MSMFDWCGAGLSPTVSSTDLRDPYLSHATHSLFFLSQEVLLLHEVGTLFKFVRPDRCGAGLHVVMPKVRQDLRICVD